MTQQNFSPQTKTPEPEQQLEQQPDVVAPPMKPQTSNDAFNNQKYRSSIYISQQPQSKKDLIKSEHNHDYDDLYYTRQMEE